MSIPNLQFVMLYLHAIICICYTYPVDFSTVDEKTYISL